MTALRDIRGQAALEAIALLIPPIAAIAADPDAAGLFAPAPQGQDPRAWAAARFSEKLPRLIKSHKGDLVAILSALEGVAPESYEASMTLPGLLGDLMALLEDEDLLRLFF